MPSADRQASSALAFPVWFTDFLADCAIRKPSPHTMKAYRQDFAAIAALVARSADGVATLRTTELNHDNLRAAFAVYAETHSAAAIRRCWSTWNTLCTFLYTARALEANPMALIGRPKVPKSLPKSYPPQTLTELIAAIDADHGSTRRNDWPERDLAITFTALLAGLRSDELITANIGDVRQTDNGGVLHVRGKGNKERRIPFGVELLDVLERYLDTRASRFPQARTRSPGANPLSALSPKAPLFVGADGERITRGTLQYRILRAFKKAGINSDRSPGALVHGLRHTFATELANANVSVYTLMKLLGHESMATSQRYVDGAGADTRSAAELNPIYDILGARSQAARNSPMSKHRNSSREG